MERIGFGIGGEELSAHLARPAGTGRLPAVLLLPAIAGVNPYILRVAERLAAQGYVVLPLDYYAREGQAPDVSTPEAIGVAVANLPDGRVLADASAAMTALRGHPSVDPNRIATLGFCIGGMYAYLSACEIDGLVGAVDYYGTVRYRSTSANKPRSPLDRAANLKAPLLGHFGSADRLIGLDEVQAFEDALRAAGKTFELFVYRGAPHAFDEDFRPVFRPAAAQEAWSRTLAFLDWYARGQARL